MSWPALLERRGFVLVLIAVWALAYLPHLGTRTLRLEEGRRATPAREMLANSDFVRPTLYGNTYVNKPPMFFWMVAAVGSLLGDVSPLATRIPSVLAALGCALIALRFAPNVLDRSTRSLAALFVLASSTLLDKGTLGEIEATLCLLVAGSLKIWWDGNRPTGQTLSSWLLVGIVLGLTGILKGPAGSAIFYLTIGPYLIWSKRWRELFTFGHLACLGLAVLPAAIWTCALVDRGAITASELIEVWKEQLGLNQSAQAVTNPGEQLSRRLTHYAEFPIQVAGMFFPAILWAPFALRRRWSESHDVPNDIRRFLVCGTFVPFLAFYLYPESRARHLMAACFPTAMLAAVVATAMIRVPGRWSARGHFAALFLTRMPALIALGGVALTATVHVESLPIAIAGFLVAITWSRLALTISRQTPRSAGIMTFAANLCALLLAAWFVTNLVVIPWRAPYSTTTDALVVSKRLPQAEPVYTTRTFPGKGERFYNMQFHLTTELRAADDLDALKRAAPCIAVVDPEERTQLESEGYAVNEIGRLGGRDGQPEVHVIRLGPVHSASNE